MKEKDKSSGYERIRNVVLYREDLDEIIQILKDREFVVTISDPKFEYEGLDEVVKQRGGQPKELEIEGLKSSEGYGRVTVSFSEDCAAMSFGGLGAPKVLWYELRQFLHERRSWLKRIAKPFYWSLVAIIAGNVEFFVFLQGPLRSQVPWWAHTVAFMGIASWPASYFYSRKVSTVILTTHHEGGFWRRNRDAIILLVIGAILGGIVTYVVTLLKK